MKLFANENNPAALKLLISASFAGKDVSLEIVNVEDKRFQTPKRLPVLQLDSGVQLFSANSGARYLLPPVDASLELQVDEWLEFEASQLSPAILNGFNVSGKIDNSSRAVLVKHLTLLENSLAGKQYLVGDSISVADISVWTSLFPIITEPQQYKELFADKCNLIKWFENLKSQPHFKSAVTKVCPKTGLSGLQNLGNAIWCPSPSTGDLNVNELKQKLLLNHENSIDSNGSPVKEESVTEAELAAAREAWEQGSGKLSPKPRVTPVLPVKGERNILITSALPYVNNVPHLGNIIGCVLSADVFARFCRLRNYNTLYISGTDEYGTATETKALEEGLTPQQICDKYFAIHNEIYRWFNIGFDHFGRTTTRQQTAICQEMFLDLHQAGLMTTQSMEQLLCEKCDRFLADRFVEGTCPKCKYEDARGDQCDGCGNLINATELINPRCKVCSTTPVIRHSDQFFLELPKVEPQLREWLDRVTDDWSHNAKVITRSWLKDGLKSRCITRDLKWGIPVPLPEYSSKVFYVWFDAPIGYMSMTCCYTDQWRQWWQPDSQLKVQLYQFMAKDNVPFHSVMFPTSLIGANKGYTLVSHLMATEYLNYEDGKFSKSRGVGVFGTDARDTGIAADVWRFYLLYVRPESQDSSFSWHDLATKNNSELLNNLGNFINRALMFAEKSFDCRVPAVALSDADTTVVALVNRELEGYTAALERARLRDGLRHILSVSRHGNQYMQSQQPWVLLKGSDADRSRAGTVIGLCCNICCLLAALLHPYMPATALTLLKQLNVPADSLTIPDRFSPLLSEGHQLGKPAPLFTKLDMDHIETLKKKYAGSQKSRTPEADVKISSVSQLTEAVAKQAEVVRKMKAGGAAKSEWQPHVTTLLDLKKKLAAAEASEAKTASESKSESVDDLTEAVAKQAELVRTMKTSGAAKAEVQPHITTLLDLKKKLAAAEANQPKLELVKPVKSAGDQDPVSKTTGNQEPVSKPAGNQEPVSTLAGSMEVVVELEAQVAKQAELVRDLKSGGATKADVAPHVAKLLQLKSQLSAAQGVDSAATTTGGGKKKKGKK